MLGLELGWEFGMPIEDCRHSRVRSRRNAYDIMLMRCCLYCAAGMGRMPSTSVPPPMTAVNEPTGTGCCSVYAAQTSCYTNSCCEGRNEVREAVRGGSIYRPNFM